MNVHNNPKVDASPSSFYTEADQHAEGLFPKVTELVAGRARAHMQEGLSVLHCSLQPCAVMRLHQLIFI